MFFIEHAGEKKIETYSLEPLGDKIVFSKIELASEGFEEGFGNPWDGIGQRFFPLLRNYVDEEAVQFYILRVVVADLDAHWKLVVNTQKSQSDCSVFLPLFVYLGSEAVICDGELEDGIFNICIEVALGKGVFECHQGILFGYNLEIGE